MALSPCRKPGVFAPNHKLRPTVTALAIGNVGKRGDTTPGGHAAEGGGDSCDKPHSHDTSRIAPGGQTLISRGKESIRLRHLAPRAWQESRPTAAAPGTTRA